MPRVRQFSPACAWISPMLHATSRITTESTELSPGSGAPPSWHALAADEAIRLLDSRDDGLSADEAARRLARHGPNRLPRSQRRGPIARFLAQSHNVLIYVLLGSAAVSLVLGHMVDAAVIVGVVILNA